MAPLDLDRVDDLARVFACDAVTGGCWCMWHIVRVVDFHAAGAAGNRESFVSMLASSDEPLGVIAYDDGEPVGWCAVGPTARYVRAMKTPTLRGRDPAEDDGVWFVPCFFVAPQARDRGVAAALIAGAVAVARDHGAVAIEGFPDAEGKRSLRGAYGGERLFREAGFEPVRRPSDARVIMRLDLVG